MSPKRKKKERGRPMKKRYPPRIDATAEEIAQAVFAMPKDHKWKYQESEPEYCCVDCKQTVHYPDTLYRGGRCETCHAAVSV